MKIYALIQNNEDGDCSISFYDNEKDRDTATILAIFGELRDEQDEVYQDLQKLREDGILEFEGDPSIEWRTVVHVGGQLHGDATYTDLFP